MKGLKAEIEGGFWFFQLPFQVLKCLATSAGSSLHTLTPSPERVGGCGDRAEQTNGKTRWVMSHLRIEEETSTFGKSWAQKQIEIAHGHG